jgi:hypothetical protein
MFPVNVFPIILETPGDLCIDVAQVLKSTIKIYIYKEKQTREKNLTYKEGKQSHNAAPRL